MSEEISQASAQQSATTESAAAEVQQAAQQVEAAASASASAPAADAAAQAADDGSLLDGTEEQAEPQGKATDPIHPDTLGAPESYDYKDVKLADGVQLGEDTLKAFGEVAKELDLSQSSASKIVSKVAPAIVAEQQKQVQTMRSKWINDVKADPSIDWRQNGRSINQAYKALTTPALRDLFKRTGLDCNPDVVRMFKTYADRVSQDSFEKGAAGARQTISAKQFYNRSNMND